jgi:hypothetical protein
LVTGLAAGLAADLAAVLAAVLAAAALIVFLAGDFVVEVDLFWVLRDVELGMAPP